MARKKWAFCGLTVLISVGCLLLIIEVFVFPHLLPFLPLKRHNDLPLGLRVLAQSSKKSTTPKHYVALLGDSYAYGAGDSLLAANPNRNASYHSSHYLHELTGKDVISLGHPGAGSLKGIVSAPLGNLSYLNRTWFYRLGEPDTLIVYFYEGNDFDDNISDLHVRFNPRFDKDRFFDGDYFRRFIQRVAVEQDALYQRSSRFFVFENLFVPRFIYKSTRNTFKNLFSRKVSKPADPTNYNHIRVNAQDVAVSDLSQDPAMELTDLELRQSLHIFEQSLLYLKNRFPTQRIGVVYIPSPLSCYDLVGKEAFFETSHNRKWSAPVQNIRARNLELTTKIRRIVTGMGLGFCDAGEKMKQTCRKELLYGPNDWNHFNESGYRLLAGIVADFLNELELPSKTGEGGIRTLDMV